jgi:hypothetical protein
MPAGPSTFPRPAAAPRWLNTGFVLAAIGLGLLLFIEVLLRRIFFDERQNINFLWLISQGLRPDQDFWSTYPVAGYALFRPLFQALPENAAVVIVLRLCSVLFFAASFAVVCLWSAKLSGRWWLPLLPLVYIISANTVPQEGLTRVLVEFRTDSIAMLLAFVSLALLFFDARGWRRVLAVACAAVSIVVMPKYLYVLATAHIFELLGKILDRRFDWRTFFASAIGALAGLLAIVVLLFYANTNLLDDWRWVFVFRKNWLDYVLRTGNHLGFFIPNLLEPFLDLDFALTICLVTGFCAFLICAHRQRWRGQHCWVGYGLLAGLLLNLWQMRLPWDQYLEPVLFPLIFFFPFIGLIIPAGRPRILIEGALFAVLAINLLASLGDATRRFVSTPLFDDIILENNLHVMIPPNERTVGAFPLLFRRPLTFLTYDEQWGDPPGFDVVIQSDPAVAREFTGARLAEALRANPPALFQTTSDIPVAWSPVIRDFLLAHRTAYKEVTIRDEICYVRRDLYVKHPLDSPVAPANP